MPEIFDAGLLPSEATKRVTSQLVLQILNRERYCIDCNAAKGIMTEFAYSAESEKHESLDGIRLDLNLATGLVWDNNDVGINTEYGKETLHATVEYMYIPESAR